jgi:hypothetical protein
MRWRDLGGQLDDLRKRLAQARYKCRLIDGNAIVHEALASLAERQPFILAWGSWGSDAFAERVSSYQRQVQLYEETLQKLCDLIHKRYFLE